MFAGVPGNSAEDAWYSTAVLTEYLKVVGQDYSGATADLYKCFDQLVLELIEATLRTAGLPERILRPYISCIKNLVVYNCFAGHIGEAHHHTNGIPQGCPFSMMIMALLARLWILQTRTTNVRTRILADDILVLASGKFHLKDFVEAFTNPLNFFIDIGGRISAEKSFSFSSSSTARKWLQHYT